MLFLFLLCACDACIPAVLGNHDYTGNALAQQDPAIREVDSRYLNLAKSFIVNSGEQCKSTYAHSDALIRTGLDLGDLFFCLVLE